MSLFQSQNTALFESIVSQYKGREMNFTFPDYLTYYAARALDVSAVRQHCTVFAPYSAFKSGFIASRIVFVLTAADRTSIDGMLNFFEKVPTFVKVILVIPRQTILLTHVLASHGFLVNPHPSVTSGEVAIHDFPAEILQIEPDFFLMPCYQAFRRYFVVADGDDLFVAARAIHKIQKYFGKIRQVVSVGAAGHAISDLLLQFGDEFKGTALLPQIDSLILFDRATDLVTPMTSQVNIEGMLSTVFAKNYGIVPDGDAPLELFVSETDAAVRTVRMLSLPQCHSFREELNAEVQAALERLSLYGATLEEAYLAKFRKAVMSVCSLVDAAAKMRHTRFPHHRAMIDAEGGLLYRGTAVQSFVENLILIYDDWRNAIRLLSLQSALGVSMRNFRTVQTEIVAEFGRGAQEGILDLERVGYISADGIPFPFKRQSLFAPVGDDGECTDPIGTALGGFVPPSVRIVTAIAEESEGTIPKKISVRTRGERPPRDEGEVRKILVFFIGGVTATEVGTLRNVARSGGAFEFIVGSTDQITADSFLEQFCPFLKATGKA